MERIDKPQGPPSNYLVGAILTTIFCCLPFGIVSLIFAAQVNTKWESGDYEGAANASKNAKIWAWVSFGIAAAIFIIAIVFSIIAVAVGFWSDAFNW